jgi:hypothetical protein
MLHWITDPDPQKALAAVGLAWLSPLVTVLGPTLREILYYCLITIAIYFGVPTAWLRAFGWKDENGGEKIIEVEPDTALTPFIREQRQKSKRKVAEVDNNKDNFAVVNKCKYIMGPIIRVGGFASSTKVKKTEGIKGKESFDRIVDNIGKQLDLTDIHIEGIKEAANADRDQFKIRDFKGGMSANGSMILHTGSYMVERTDTEGDETNARFNFEIAMSVINITEIEFVRLGGTGAADAVTAIT